MKQPELWIGSALLGFLVLLLGLPLAASATSIGGILRCLPPGWWHFLTRNVPQLTWNWNLIISGLVYSALGVVLSTWVLRWLIESFPRSRLAGVRPRYWPWRWSLSLYATIWLLLTIAFGAGGLFRHLTWIKQDRQPWYDEKTGSMIDLRRTEMTIRQLMLENDFDLELTRKAARCQRYYRVSGPLVSEKFEVIFYGDASNKVSAYVIVARNKQLRSNTHFIAYTAEHEEMRPISELKATLNRLDRIRLVTAENRRFQNE